MAGRREYRGRLFALEDVMLRTGDAYRLLLAQGLAVLISGGPSRAAEVVHADDRLDAQADALREDVVELIALQSPVADELRLLSALVQVTLRLERVGELAVNLARAGRPQDPDDSDPLVRQLAEMGMYADVLLARSLEQFARRRTDLSEVETLDDALDRLRGELLLDLRRCATHDPGRVDWVMRMTLAASWLERCGDLAVAVARQVPYVISGASARHGRREPG